MITHAIAPVSLAPSNGDDDRRVGENVLFIHHRTVDHAGSVWSLLLAIASVDVSEDMHLGLKRGHLKKGNFMYAKEPRRGFWGFGAV